MSASFLLAVAGIVCAAVAATLVLVAVALAAFLVSRRIGPEHPTSQAWAEAGAELGLTHTPRPMLARLKLHGTIDGHPVRIIAADLKQNRYDPMQETTRYVIGLEQAPSPALTEAVAAVYEPQGAYVRAGRRAIELNCPWTESRPGRIVAITTELLDLARQHR